MTVSRTPLLLAVLAAVLVLPVVTPVAQGDTPIEGDCRTAMGMFSSAWESTEDLDAMAAWAGAPVALGGTFHDVDENTDSAGSNTMVILEQVWAAGTVPVAYLRVDGSAADIAVGLHDLDIREWAIALRDWIARGEGRGVVVAPLPEMNGDWVPYGASPDDYADAYRRVHDGVVAAGVDTERVRWMFAPNNVGSEGDRMADYWPGGDVVDLLGMSAFNFGSDLNEDGLWHDVHRVLDAPLRELKTVAPELPIMFSEVGSAAVGGDRERWVEDLVHHAIADPRVIGLVWFNFDKEADFRVWNGDDSGSESWRDALTRSTTVVPFPTDDFFGPGPIPFATPDFVRRHAGPDRIGTAVALSRHAFDTSTVAVLARSDQYADALTGGPLARALDAPLLLTDRASLSPQVAGELRRLGVERVILLGGANAILTQVVVDVQSLGIDVTRRSGSDRFGTAAAVAEELDGPIANVYVVEGTSPDPARGWPDAVTAAFVAAWRGQPVLLTRQGSLPQATADALAGLRPAQVTIVGGPTAVSAGVERDIAARVPSVTRLAGATRYGTSAAVADHAVEVGMDTHTVWLATGRNWPDALAAGPIVARCAGTLLLVDGEFLSGSPETSDWVAARRGTHIQLHLLGGEVAIRTTTADRVTDRAQ